MTSRMKQWRAEAFGNPSEVLRLTEADVPSPAEGQVLIRVLATGIALPDALMTQGNYPALRRAPVVPGQEVVGIVEAVGANVPSAKIGDRILATTLFQRAWGGLAEYCLANAQALFRVPNEMPDAEGAGFLIAYHTAIVALLDRGGLAADQSVLILGGAGSSGSAAIQVAKVLGARVCATARSDAKNTFCYSLGADLVVDLGDDAGMQRASDFTGGKGFDLVFDPVGGSIYQRASKLVASFGRIVLVGYASGEWAVPNALDMVIRSYSVTGALMSVRSPDERARAEALLDDFYRQGKIKPPIDSTFSFDRAVDAIARVQRSETLGKVVVAVDPSVATSEPVSR